MRPSLSALLLFLSCTAPVAAQQVTTRDWTDEQGVRWTETTTVEVVEEEPGNERVVGISDAPDVKAVAHFGPFAVIDGTRAALVAETDSLSPADFAAMLRAYPGIRTLELVDCPGTVDDTANLRLGRMIRAAGIATDVPPGGSVRSGAVELFLAGARRSAAPDAEFAVHAWLDEDGRQPQDFAHDAPVNRAYIGYYREMGMAPAQAVAFYALTNSVPNRQVLWLHTPDVARYAALESPSGS
ncbi:MAG: hypothetical protein B7Z39_01910 [Novosphingobium sp. 12-64-8]|nr:MAG: hypothetical protein B7Z39_01910 [Novosphingobium sp. 12-64-8]